eukprot:SAG31_NODE_12278_length_953_cov_0.932084_2_plen_25_part_01
MGHCDSDKKLEEVDKDMPDGVARGA